MACSMVNVTFSYDLLYRQTILWLSLLPVMSSQRLWRPLTTADSFPTGKVAEIWSWPVAEVNIEWSHAPHSPCMPSRFAQGQLYFLWGGRWRQEVKAIVIVRLPFLLWQISIYVAEPSRVSCSLFRVSHFHQNSRGSRTNGLATDEHTLGH